MRTTMGLGVPNGLAFAGETATLITSLSESIRYKLRTDSGRMTSWGDLVSNDTERGIGDRASQSQRGDGHVSRQTTPASGSYLDAMTVTVTY